MHHVWLAILYFTIVISTEMLTWKHFYYGKDQANYAKKNMNTAYPDSLDAIKNTNFNIIVETSLR